MDIEFLYSLVTILGPILLIGIVLWAYIRNKQSASRREIAKAERGARELRRDIEEEQTS